MIDSPKHEAFSPSIQLLALCPLLAVSDTVVNAIAMGVAVLLIVPTAAGLMTLIRPWVSSETLLPASVLIIAGLVACTELLMLAWFHDLRESLGIFLPLIVSNLVIVSEVQAPAIARSLKISAGIAVTLLVLGIARELVGRGSLLHDAGVMLGSWAAGLESTVFRVDMGFLLAMLPPGAFISLGLLIAARNWLAQRAARSTVMDSA